MDPDRPGEWDVTREWIDRGRFKTTEDRVAYVRMLAHHLHRTERPDSDLCSEIGIGPLEGLLFDHEEELWPELERLAREDIRFRRALSAVWASNSSMLERREALLEELGESPILGVLFRGTLRDFSDPPLLGWRAVEVRGDVDSFQLARLLREIADWAERRDEESYLAAMRDRRLREDWYEWSEARHKLGQAAHALAVEPDPNRLPEHVHQIEEAREREETCWHAISQHL